MALHKGLPILPFPSRAALHRWLAAEHAKRPEGVWLKFAKKASGIASVTYEEAREVAIIFGWIDGLKHGVDQDWYAIRFTPRRPRSKWSKINRDIAEGLEAGGKLRAAGKREVEAARADGRWELAYSGQASMEMPEDFARALKKSRPAQATWKATTAANRYAILYRVHDAKREATRVRRIEQLVEMLADGQVLHPPAPGAAAKRRAKSGSTRRGPS